MLHAESQITFESRQLGGWTKSLEKTTTMKSVVGQVGVGAHFFRSLS